MRSTKVAVVIQGPLVTYGQGPNNSKSGFVTTDIILHNVQKLRQHRLDHTVHTWIPKEPREKSALDMLGEAGINIICDPVPDFFDPDHRYKQHFAVYRGMRALVSANKDVSYILKMRTDMLMPPSFWEWVDLIVAKDDEKLYVSELMDRPCYLGDFLYLAKKGVMSRFLESIIESKGCWIHPSIAVDLGVKYCISRGYCGRYVERNRGRYRFMVDSMLARRRGHDEWNTVIAETIGVLPKNIWEQIIWRERKIGWFLDTSSFKFDSLPNRLHENFINRISGIVMDLYRYFRVAKKHKFILGSILILFRVVAFFWRSKQKLGGLYKKIVEGKKGVVLGRVACLGKDVFLLHPEENKNNTLVNQQKMRVDLWVDLINGSRRCKPEQVRMYLSRKDIYPMLDEQAHMPWQTCGPVQYLLMDSFSELTDQLFVHKKEGWAFCSHYQDIEHSPEFQDEFECRGLLQLGHLEQAYIAFFNWFAEEYPDTPVIFLQFPASLDQREEFKKRADEIKRVIKIIAENHTFIRVLEAGVSEVVPADGDSFPYHFGHTTKMSFVKKWVGA